MKLNSLLMLLMMCALVARSVAERVKPSEFDEKLTVGEHELELRGSGAFKFLRWDVLYAGLYLPSCATKEEEILAPETPKALEIHYNWKVSAEDMRSRILRALKREPKVDFAKVEAGVLALLEMFQDAKKGDVARVTWIPGEGLEVMMNDEMAEPDATAEVAEAFFRIWISEKGLNEGLSKNLMGH